MCQRKGGFGGVKRGQGNHTVPLPPFAPRRGHGVPPPVNTGSPVPPKAAIAHAHFERKAASTGCAAVSAEGLPSGGLIPSCSPHGAQRAPPDSLRAAPNAAATGSASHSPPLCSSLPPRPLPSRHPIQMVIPAYFFLRFSLFFSAALRAAPLLCPAAPAFFLRQR